MKIITGGQAGADKAGNYFADKYNISNEVNIFKEFKPLDGLIYPESTQINYVCNKPTYISNLVCRTKYNVMKADFTLIMIEKPIEFTKGSKLTFFNCVKYKKDCIYFNVHTYEGLTYTSLIPNINNEIKYFEKVKEIINAINPQIINIAGERSLDRNLCMKILEKLFNKE